MRLSLSLLGLAATADAIATAAEPLRNMTGAAPGPRLYLLDQWGARVISLKPDGTDPRIVAPNFREMPDGIAVDKAANHIYVSNMGRQSEPHSGSIVRMNLDGSGLTTIVPRGRTHTAKQLVIAQVAGRKQLYWGDREGMKVLRANLDGTGLETVVDTRHTVCRSAAPQCRYPVGVAVDAAAGHVYWTQKGPDSTGDGAIFRAPLELPPGAAPDRRPDIQTLFAPLPCPIDLAWVPELRSLFWTDRQPVSRGVSVYRARVPAEPVRAGQLAHQTLFGGLRTGIGIAVDVKTQRLWATDLSGRVWTSDLDGKGAKQIASGLGQLVGITYVE